MQHGQVTRPCARPCAN
ncbi:hypothetical protein F383_11136 [Gossypium arboreum]|uniref:Uncharacterized protein n=1 Tax=Gossypium arboreum TaxID=29729 RepID=A0A0B0PY92_GOSAR|nr:hypothetical protein F383_11136 [Gossypium arboreum]